MRAVLSAHDSTYPTRIALRFADVGAAGDRRAVAGVDPAGRIARSEQLPAGTGLRDRLRIAPADYARAGWTVGELTPGPLGGEMGGRRLLIAIWEAASGDAAVCRQGESKRAQ